MADQSHRVRTVYECSVRHQHELCVTVGRGVPPELRCADQQSAVWSLSGGGCPVPNDLPVRVERQLRDDLQECKRRGYVLILLEVRVATEPAASLAYPSSARPAAGTVSAHMGLSAPRHWRTIRPSRHRGVDGHYGRERRLCLGEP